MRYHLQCCNPVSSAVHPTISQRAVGGTWRKVALLRRLIQARGLHGKKKIFSTWRSTFFLDIWSSDRGLEVLSNLSKFTSCPLVWYETFAKGVSPLASTLPCRFCSWVLINSFQRTFPVLFLGGMLITVLLTISRGKRGEEEQRRANWTFVVCLADACAKQTNFKLWASRWRPEV